MPRASGKDLAEVFGYAPDDTSPIARKQWKSQACPFVGNVCIKHSHAALAEAVVVYGTCSVVNKSRAGAEEVVICPQRFYGDNYATLHRCATDAFGSALQILTVDQYRMLRDRRRVPGRVGVLFGQNSGAEIKVAKQGVIDLSLDWVIAIIEAGQVKLAVPCEVQSIDTTGNYRDTWDAYSRESGVVPDSKHGMNWANVWKRLIPQLIMKSKIASTSRYCLKGSYFVLPERVYQQFEKLVGTLPELKSPCAGSLTVFTYSLGKVRGPGTIRPLIPVRKLRFAAIDFAQAFASGESLPLGNVLDDKIDKAVASL